MADDDQPSTNPFETPSPEGGDAPMIENHGGGLAQGTPNVAAKAGKTFLVLGIVGGMVLLLLYLILGGDKKKEVKETPKQISVAKPVEPPPLPQPVEPVAVTPPEKITPPPLPQPAQVPIITNPINPEEDRAAKQQAIARLRSPIITGGSGGGGGLSSITGGGSGGGNTARTTLSGSESNNSFLDNASSAPVEKVVAGRIPDLDRTIAQGRIVQATLESAINTDLPAPIRAIVSRDVYGEAGNTPLIPKGSRLIGRYNTSIGNGQTRVFVVWTRVIRPDGVDVMIGSPLVDAIGQAGVAGQVDSKFQEIFARSFVSSVMNIALAIGSDKINGGGSTSTTTTPEGGSQTSGDAVSTATTNALNRLGSTTEGFIQRFMNVPPTILVDQGTKVNVFINKDLIFPADVAGTRIIE